MRVCAAHQTAGNGPVSQNAQNNNALSAAIGANGPITVTPPPQLPPPMAPGGPGGPGRRLFLLAVPPYSSCKPAQSAGAKSLHEAVR